MQIVSSQKQTDSSVSEPRNRANAGTTNLNQSHLSHDSLATNTSIKSTDALPPIVMFEWEFADNEPHNLGNPADSLENFGNVLKWHGNIEAHLGITRGQFQHTLEAWSTVLHPDDREHFVDAIEGHLKNGQPHFDTYRARRQDGSWLQFVHTGFATRDIDGTPRKFTGTLSNFVVLDAQELVGRESPAEQGIDLEKARAESLLRTAAHLNAQLDLQNVCEAICEEASRTIGAPSAVMLFNKSMDAFVPSAVHNMPKDYDKRYTPTLRSIYDGHVAEMGPLFLFRDAQATPDLPNHKLYLEVNMRTIGIASLIREGEVLGLLKVYSFGESRTFDENELALLQGLANQGAQAIANARLYAESQRRLANLQSLRQIDTAILGSSEVNVSLSVVLDQLVSRLGADAASFLLLNGHTRTLRYAAGRGFRTDTARRTELRMGEGWAGRAALERRILHVADLSEPEVTILDSSGANLESRAPVQNESATADLYAQHAPLKDAYKPLEGLVTEGFVTYYAVPLVAGGQIKGVLELWHRSSLLLDEEELEFLETLAGQAAIAVDNANLFRDVQRSNDELMLAYDSTLEGWSGALDLRDKETEGHSQRVTNESLRLATYIGLDDAQLLQIRRGALLHDIGKMGIPDAILLKPGPLTDEEWVIMKKHPTYALELLSSIPYLRPALEIPYSHHEKWDGSGYPNGLRGRQIPLSARIFAIVDVWDALCSDRPYRKGWPLQRVLKHIRDQAGTHFDPQVVEAFLQMHPPIEEETDEKTDSAGG
jgi:HD-GYP domain-containing protein (c-di-GMP phosphodiesterase class II)/PAS domain-containing protein